MMTKRALVAMSGGVDSAVAALLTQQQGYETSGVTLKLFNNDDVGIDESLCCSLEDIEDARSVAHRLGIPYFVYNFTENFKENVIDRFVDAYTSGRTPNPCIDCNRYVKFKHLLIRAKQLYFNYIVTGHYAINEKDEASGRFLLKKAVDETKDQSYVLYSLTQEQLAMTLFPLGELRKSEVRVLAEENGFLNASKHDSQDICFVKNHDYAGFIEFYTGKRYDSGSFVDRNGAVLGEHKGIIRYTVGQRKGLGIASQSPLYVCDILPETNRVVLGRETELYSKTVTANNINLITTDTINAPLKIKAKTRYHQKEQPAMVIQTDKDKLQIEFDSPQKAITRGQSIVLYDGEYVVGGGIIL